MNKALLVPKWLTKTWASIFRKNNSLGSLEGVLKAHKLAAPIKTEYRGGAKLMDMPLITLFDEFVAPVEAIQLIKAAGDDRNRSKGRITKLKRAGSRSERCCWVKNRQNKVVETLAARISTIVGLNVAQAESFQVVQVPSGEQCTSSFDAWNSDTEAGQEYMARGGQRLVTCLLYLGGVSKGAATIFPKLNLDIEAVKGRMVIFHNCYSDTNYRHPDTLHHILSGQGADLWVAKLRFRERALIMKVK